MTTAERPSIQVCAIDELSQKGHVVVKTADRPVVVFYNDGDVRAVDNRCPHLGFPLHRGTIKHGMITCHWHHARFDACSGGTFDLWADDVPAYDVDLRDGQVYICDRPRRSDPKTYGAIRLRDGMEHNLSLVIAKAILTLESADVDADAIVREAALFGAAGRDGWAMGLTILSAMANLRPHLSPHTAYLALLQGVRRTAADCAGQTPHRRRGHLETADLDFDRLDRWLRYWTLVRHRDGAERTLLTAIREASTPSQLESLLLAAATDRFYADGGHLVDFVNKVFELLNHIGLDHAADVLPTLCAQLAAARGGEELNSWRHPIDLVPLVNRAADRLSQVLSNSRPGAGWHGEVALAGVICGEDPQEILDGIVAAAEAGSRPEQLSKALAYAAALRVARFGTANEISDWVSALHSFSYCNGLHQAIQRCAGIEPVCGVLHGAMSVYLNRFLNVPPAALPGEAGAEDGALDDLPSRREDILKAFLDALDSQQQVDPAGRLVTRYIEQSHPVPQLIDTLTFAAVREDANFHTLQMLEAGVAQYHEWEGTAEGTHILVAVARYLAAHSPTPRSQLQTAQIARRLHRGEKVYED